MSSFLCTSAPVIPNIPSVCAKGLVGTVNALFLQFLISYWVDNEPISGSHFSILLYILPLKEYKG